MILKMMLRRKRLWVSGSLGLVWMLLLTACGASQASTSTPTETAATSAPLPTLTPTTDEVFSNKSVWHFENQSGYKYDMTIALGEPTRIPESRTLTHPLDRDFELGSACTMDPKLDVVIPAYWSAEATTAGFNTPIGMRASFADGGAGTPDGEYTGRGVAPHQNDNRLLVAQNFSDGPSCSQFSSENDWGYGGSGGFSVRWNDPVPQGSVRTDEFFIVVKGYFSPSTPQGDLPLLEWIVLRPFPGGDLNDAAMVFRDVDGWNVTTGSLKGITLSGKVVDPSVPTPTPTTSERENPSFAVDDRVTVQVDGLVIRAAPSLSSDTLAERLTSGETLRIVAGPEQGDDKTWYQVRTSDGTKGWVISKYLYSSD